MVPTDTESSEDMIAAAQRLRAVRTACRRFLMLWAMSPAKASSSDCYNDHTLTDQIDDPDALLRAISDPQNRDWSLLYRGSVLDD
jgi:hypothetical protein